MLKLRYTCVSILFLSLAGGLISPNQALAARDLEQAKKELVKAKKAYEKAYEEYESCTKGESDWKTLERLRNGTLRSFEQERFSQKSQLRSIINSTLRAPAGVSSEVAARFKREFDAAMLRTFADFERALDAYYNKLKSCISSIPPCPSVTYNFAVKISIPSITIPGSGTVPSYTFPGYTQVMPLTIDSRQMRHQQLINQMNGLVQMDSSLRRGKPSCPKLKVIADAKKKEVLRLEQEVKRLESQRLMEARLERQRPLEARDKEVLTKEVLKEQNEFEKMNAAWLKRQQKMIREAKERDKKWTKEVLDSIKSNRVPPLPVNPVLPGDILVIGPEKGSKVSTIIEMADHFFTSGETPASHALTVVKSVKGNLMFLDHTPGEGSRILSEKEFLEKYGERAVYVARPKAPVDGRVLWDAAKEAAKKSQESKGGLLGWTDFGAFGKDMVCSEKAEFVVLKATGKRLQQLLESEHRWGPVDITPEDFLDKKRAGKYFMMVPQQRWPWVP